MVAGKDETKSVLVESKNSIQVCANFFPWINSILNFRWPKRAKKCGRRDA